ncbi:MAG: T9SS type A sorting domain-containing protein [Bacteroidetes bacterium]|nr:T9SS type A sorting domain-containing protein [Bacteroidota bacterium]
MTSHSLVLATLAAVLVFAAPLAAQEYRWVHQDSIPSFYYRDVACHDGNNCVAIGSPRGEKMMVRRSIDGGRTWDPIYFDSEYVADSTHYHVPLHLNHVAQPSPEHILVACDSGRILHTEDAGAHWGIVQTSSDQSFNWISMADTLTGIAGGYNSEMFSTTDGGRTWKLSPSPDSTGLHGAFDGVCASPLVWFVLNNRRDIVRTVDGGAHWQLSRAGSHCYSLTPLSPARIWAAGGIQIPSNQRRDLILATRDSGATWQTQLDSMLPAWDGLSDIAFADSLNGIAIGEMEKIVRTTDGGRTWVLEKVNVEGPLVAAAYSAPSTALVVSNFGIILRQERVANAVDDRRDVDAAQLQVVPNPIEGSGAIRYHLAAPGLVRITLCDMLGRERTILEEEDADAGSHETPAPPGLRAGLYLVRLVTGDGTTAVRCIVQR